MKKISMITLVLASIFIANQSCKKSYFDINRDPVNATDSTVSYDVILPSALASTGSMVANQWAFLQNWMGYWARSGSYSANSVEETYNITTSFGNGIWNSIYDNSYDYLVAQNKAKAAGAGFYEGIARIMRAHNYAILVDVYNNVPYTEAGKGGANIAPIYDNGISVYKDLFKQIDTGIALIKAATTVGVNKDIATNDVMFKGDKTLWAKFGNTLKLRMIMHMFKVPAAEFDRATELTKIATEGSGYLGAGQNASVNPGYRQDKPSPFYNTFIKDAAGNATANNRYYAANAWGLEYYKWDGDPRSTKFYAPAGGTGTTYTGVAYGLPPSTANAYTSLSLIGNGLGKNYDQAAWVLTGTESLFLQAEAIQRGFIAGNAQATLSAAITESFVWLGLTSAQASTYIANNGTYADVDITAATTPTSPTATASGDKNYTIVNQKMFALNGISPFEVWTDWRRTDIAYAGAPSGGYVAGPVLSVSPGLQPGTKIPTRLFYPQSEYNFNSASVAAQGTITAQTKVFWDR